MSNSPLKVEIQMRPCEGYGGDSSSAARLDTAFASSLPSDRIAALRIPFEEENGPPGIDGVMAVSLPRSGGIGAVKLAGLSAESRHALGGLFFLYSSGSGMRVGPRKHGISNPRYFLMSHGIVLVDGGLLRPGITPDYVAEKLPLWSLALLGRTGSNHDKIIFASQAGRLIETILMSNGYRGLGTRLVDAD